MGSRGPQRGGFDVRPVVLLLLFHALTKVGIQKFPGGSDGVFPEWLFCRYFPTLVGAEAAPAQREG